MYIQGCVAPFGNRGHGQVVSTCGAVAPGPNPFSAGPACTGRRDLAAIKVQHILCGKALSYRAQNLISRQAQNWSCRTGSGKRRWSWQ